MAVQASHRETIYQNDEIRYFDPMYGSGITDCYPAPATVISSLPCNRKRLRDSSFSFDPEFCYSNAPIINPNAFEFLSEDISSQIYQQQFEIDRFIANHNDKVRAEIGEIRRRNSVRFAAACEGIVNRLKNKEDEIMKIGQLNRLLEEKVKSMSVENQIWRELAQTNEATANALRNNLQQVLNHRLDFSGDGDDAESHCGSNFEEDNGGERKASIRNRNCNRRCRKCGKEESCVLLLPCRHLCVCSVCVSSISICPVCKSVKTAGVHVNMS